MGILLDQINNTGDIKRLAPSQYGPLAQEIREFLVEKVSVTGGHLASNLGTVELTMALHLALDLPNDKIVWDVGHQSYTHKILTGRKEGFEHLRQYGGMSGFPKRAESDTDSFDTGHASNAISAALGMARARDILGEKRTIVAVIGDGALTGGLAYEALNNAAQLNTNMIIVLNDNDRSISENVGGMHNYLNDIRTSDAYLDLRDKVYYSLQAKNPVAADRIRRTKNFLKSPFVPGMLFEEMGLTYLGPVDGNDTNAVLRALKDAKRIRKAVVVHVKTQKGRGYEPAVNHPARFHGTSPFDIATGLPKSNGKPGYTDIFSTVMVKMGQRDPKVVAITAAMADGVGLKRFRNIYPERFFDVGIAEGHAVTFAAGLAASGLRPVVAIYSTFLQRAYDHIAIDVCMQDLPVVFAIDRAGLVGADGETHQGVFDLSYLTNIPNLVVTAPKNKWELSDLLKFGLKYGHPFAIRYPRGAAYDGMQEHRAKVALGKSETILQGSGVLLFAVGVMVEIAVQVHDRLAEHGVDSTVVNARFVKPFDKEMLDRELPHHPLLVTMEENVRAGGFGEQVAAWVAQTHRGQEVLQIALPDRFIEHGSCDILRKECQIDADSITERILARLDKGVVDGMPAEAVETSGCAAAKWVPADIVRQTSATDDEQASVTDDAHAE